MSMAVCAIVAEYAVPSARFPDGVNVMVLPVHENVPGTCGESANADSTVLLSISLSNVTEIELEVETVPPVGYLVITDGRVEGDGSCPPIGK
jgi:hypothetical protein